MQYWWATQCGALLPSFLPDGASLAALPRRVQDRGSARGRAARHGGPAAAGARAEAGLTRRQPAAGCLLPCPACCVFYMCMQAHRWWPAGGRHSKGRGGGDVVAGLQPSGEAGPAGGLLPVKVGRRSGNEEKGWHEKKFSQGCCASGLQLALIGNTRVARESTHWTWLDNVGAWQRSG